MIPFIAGIFSQSINRKTNVHFWDPLNLFSHLDQQLQVFFITASCVNYVWRCNHSLIVTESENRSQMASFFLVELALIRPYSQRPNNFEEGFERLAKLQLKGKIISADIESSLKQQMLNHCGQQASPLPHCPRTKMDVSAMYCDIPIQGF